MRHQRKGFKLGRTHSHRKATLAALSNALIRHKRITTTVTKAKALRQFVEPLINRAKHDTMHNRRQVFRRLQDKHAVKELFGEIAERIGDRNGGYTRIVKLGRRAGDAAELALIELVDYNDVRPEGSGGAARRRTRRGGRRRGQAAAAAPTTETPVTEAPQTEEPKADAEAPVTEAPQAEEPGADAAAPVAEAPQAEEPKADAAAPGAEEAGGDEEDKTKEA
ncbi:MAG: hypothetical protein KatS3mg042_0298 [Rhodothermaceae bacterium]|nr:MAG: hypothetical protein KatS3mg042_0298 [Rhodothermaceae bacterium]